MLIEGTPEHIDVYRLCSLMKEVDGVSLIHDFHVWTIAPHYEALTAHVLINPDYQGDLDALRCRLREIAFHEFGIGHITLQLENLAERMHGRPPRRLSARPWASGRLNV